jgi:hypothetical protein
MTTTSNKYSKTLIATLSILFFVGFSAAAVTGATGNSADDVEVGQSTTLQTVSYDVSIDGASSSETVTLDVSNANAASLTIDSVTVSGSGVSKGTVNAITSSTADITINDDDQNGVAHTATVDVTLKQDSTGVSTTSSSSISYDLTGNENTGTVSFDYVDTQPSVNSVNLGETSGDLDLSFTTDQQLGTNSGDIAVDIAGPTTDPAYEYAQGDFSETDNGDGTYTYSLDTTQAYNDGEG